METTSCHLNLVAKTCVLFVGVFRNYRGTWGRAGRGTARGDNNDEEEEEEVASLLGTIVSACVGGGAQQGDTYIIPPSPNTDARLAVSAFPGNSAGTRTQTKTQR